MTHRIAALVLLAGLSIAGGAHASGACDSHADCRRHGFCSLDVERNQCIADSRRDCRRSMACEAQGLCTPMYDRCVASFDADCEQSAVCRVQGRCRNEGGTCVAGHGSEPGQLKPRTTVNVGKLLGGVSLSLLGLGGIIGGVALIGSECGTHSRGMGGVDCGSYAAWSPLLLLGGAGMVAGGIVLAAKSREKKGYTPNIRVGAGSVDLRWQF